MSGTGIPSVPGRVVTAGDGRRGPRTVCVPLADKLTFFWGAGPGDAWAGRDRAKSTIDIVSLALGWLQVRVLVLLLRLPQGI